jgi:hypothetical protein
MAVVADRASGSERARRGSLGLLIVVDGDLARTQPTVGCGMGT